MPLCMFFSPVMFLLVDDIRWNFLFSPYMYRVYQLSALPCKFYVFLVKFPFHSLHLLRWLKLLGSEFVGK